MTKAFRSSYREIGTGIAIENIKSGSYKLKIHALELFPEHKEVFKIGKENKTVTKAMGSTYGTGALFGQLEKSTVIECMWYNDNSNRITPPSIRAGETVRIFQSGNSDKFYWTSGQYEPDLRGQEEVAHAYSNIPRQTDDSKHLEKLTKDKSYYTVLSPLKKFARLFTAANDKEKYTWDFFLNTKEGVFRVLNGMKDMFQMGNGVVHIKTKKIILEADEIIINGERFVKVKTPKMEENVSSKKTSGGSYTIGSTLMQKGSSTFSSSVTMGGNASTSDGSKVL